MKISISLSDDLVNKIDEYADNGGMTRSGFIGQSCKFYIQQLEVTQCLKSMSNAMNRIAATGVVDEKTQKELEQFTQLASFIANK
jgi:metal-responsive CopG/Arc/MetJ family transcriptional regulator